MSARRGCAASGRVSGRFGIGRPAAYGSGDNHGPAPAPMETAARGLKGPHMSIAIRRVHPSEFGHDTHIPPGYSRSRPCEFRPATTTLDDGTRIDLVLVESPVIVRDSLIHFDDDPELGAIAVDVSHRDGVVTRAVIDAADMSHFAVLARRECPRLSQKELRDCVIAAAVQDAVDLVGHPLRVRM